MRKECDELVSIVCDTYDKYKTLDDKVTSIQLSEDKWSLKELFGHLIDSASNNHQRFIRLQLERELEFPAYHYDWNKIQKYNDHDFTSIIELWRHFNMLLAHVIDNINPETKIHYWINDGDKICLEHLVVDYIRHLREHLVQLDERYEEVKSLV